MPLYKKKKSKCVRGPKDRFNAYPRSRSERLFHTKTLHDIDLSEYNDIDTTETIKKILKKADRKEKGDDII